MLLPFEGLLSASETPVLASVSVDHQKLRRAELAVYVGERAVLVGTPLREAGEEVVDDSPGVGVEDVRSVSVHQNAVFVVLVVHVARDVETSVEHVYTPAGSRQALGNDAASEAAPTTRTSVFVPRLPELERVVILRRTLTTRRSPARGG